ncbi:RsiV family protein [Nocardia huaxiensis]|uniref:RsiV family protein n=1 Tax=Nocardia huaxiensis TaxID=2755382 RepID=UPI001E50891E|nr:RsiV family protein [Nocardia huaxiensis]UFS96232.1 RsiV family protein [Nocardia huaxiensis]
MTREAVHYLLAALMVVFAVCAGRVIAHAAPGEFYNTSYTKQGTNYLVEVPNVGIDGVDGPLHNARKDFDNNMDGHADRFIATYVGEHVSLMPAANYLYLGDHVLSGKIGVNVYQEGVVEGFEDYATHNTNTVTGEPISLLDLFTDLDSGLQALSYHSQALLDSTYGVDGYDRTAAEPRYANFHNWAVAVDGMRIYFGDIASHAAGNVMITLSWNVFHDVFNPAMAEVIGA